MAFNGSGVFVISSTGNPVVTATTISSTWANALTADLGTGLTTCITKDGQTTTTAAIPFGTLGIVTDKVNESTATAGVAIKGSTANPATNAAAGYVGEVITSTVASGSGVSLTTATPKTITSIALTAGDWDVSGMVGTEASVAIAQASGGSSDTNNTAGAEDQTINYGTIAGQVTNRVAIPTSRISLSGSATYYLVITATFSSGTCVGFGRITARRAR